MTVGEGVVRAGSRRAALGMLAGLLVLAAACTSEPADGAVGPSSDAPPPTSSTPPAKPVSLKLVPADKAADVPPGDPITVTAADGKLTQVVLTNQDGKKVAGTLSADGLTWQSTEPLGYGKTYTTTATGQGADGSPVTVKSTFKTVRPRTQAFVSMNPLDGQTVGVGQPLAFYFDTAIADKAAVEKAIKITTTPAVTGAFYWFDDRQVHWRPEKYWAPGTKITINAAIYGKNFGNGVYGQEDRTAKVAIGDSVIAVADGKSHKMSVSVNGKTVRSVPISMGKPKHETPNGTYVVMSEHTNYTMDSSTYGVPADAPDGYRTTVAIASRLSNSGIFFHSAPWSVGDQGRRNVSHGCINMSSENAKWLQGLSKKGDVFVVRNSGGAALQPWDGLGDWQISWKQWKSGGKK